MKGLLICLVSTIPTLLSAHRENQDHPASDAAPYGAWYTGTYLAATAVNTTAIEPFFTFFGVYGDYKSDWKLKGDKTTWIINPLIDFQLALTEKIGFEVITGFSTKIKDGKSSTHFVDTGLLLGYQISLDQKNTAIPDCRIYLATLFPTGKHDRLDPVKDGIDQTGQGAYFFGPTLAFAKMFRPHERFFNLYWSLSYFFPTEAHIKGFSAYGGGPQTKGKIRPGQTLLAILSGEYSLNQHWVIGFDTQLLYQRSSSSFKGRRGLQPNGSPVQVGLPSMIEISFAPQIEYNFSRNSGILFGSWFTLAGRNTKAFASIFFAYLYVF